MSVAPTTPTSSSSSSSTSSSSSSITKSYWPGGDWQEAPTSTKMKTSPATPSIAATAQIFDPPAATTSSSTFITDNAVLESIAKFFSAAVSKSYWPGEDWQSKTNESPI